MQVGQISFETTLTDEVIEKCWEYVNGAWETEGNAIPSIASLAIYVDRRRQLLYKWKGKAKTANQLELGDIFDRVMEMQEVELTNKGLVGDFNAPLTKMFLHKHGYHDKSEVSSTVTSRDASTMTDDELESIVSESD